MQYDIKQFDELDSTNAQAARENYAHGTIISAAHQSSGRGQRGNRWSSAKGENLMFSLVVEPTHVAVCEQFTLSEMASLASCEALAEMGVECKIKWPNDLYVDGKKIGGILIEHTSQGEFLTRTIVGIGINVNQTTFDPSIPNPTSLKLLAIQSSPTTLLDLFCNKFSSIYDCKELHMQYMKNIWRADDFYPYRDARSGALFQAQITNVDPFTGELTLTTDAGQQKKYWFKEVEVVL